MPRAGGLAEQVLILEACVNRSGAPLVTPIA
jgi:hypothetical protein